MKPSETMASWRDHEKVEFIAHLHHSVEHEQAMVRRSVWSQPTRENEHG